MPALVMTRREGAAMERERRDLERRSDELLAENGRGDGEYPCHTERWMEILSYRECPGVEAMPAPGGEVEARLGAMVVDANLTRRQRTVIRLVTRGLSGREIAAQMGISEAQVSRIRHAALDRIRSGGVTP
jgi:DNA-binding CsgD family transcriptional regulator